MADGESEGMAIAKIGVIEMYRGAFAALRRHWLTIGIAFLCWLALMVGLGAWWLSFDPLGLLWIYIAPEILVDSSSVVRYLVEELSYAAVMNAISAVFVVLVLRVLLTGTPTGKMAGLADPTTAMFQVYLFATLLRAAFLAGVVVMGGPESLEASGPMQGTDILKWLILILVSGLVLARFCLVYVSAALGLGWRIREDLRLSKRVSGRLVIAIGMLWVATVIVFDLVATSAVFQSITEHAYTVGALASHVLRSAEEIVRFIVFLALIATVFAKLTGRGLSGVHDDLQSRKEIVQTFD